jgi:hypothetical protein
MLGIVGEQTRNLFDEQHHDVSKYDTLQLLYRGLPLQAASAVQDVLELQVMA